VVIQVSSYRRNRSPSVESRRHVTGRKGPATVKPFPPIPDTDESAVDELRRHRDPSADDT
jgi:hypothetical protein